MSTKVPQADSAARDAEDTCESLLTAFAPGASPETLAALRAALREASEDGASIELDPALDGEIELDPALSDVELDPALNGVIEADPALASGRTPSQDDRTADDGRRPTGPADGREPPDEMRSAIEPDPPVADRKAISEKNPVEPTLGPPHALVIEGAESPNEPGRPAGEGDAGRVAAALALEPPEEPETEEPMFDDAEAHDGAQESEEEAAMAESTMKAQPEAGDHAAPPDVDAGHEHEAVIERESDHEAATGRESGDAAGDGRPPADDLFDAVPVRARHFMALLEREGTLLMPQVMAHLGLVRPKGVGGVIEPIQRLARLMNVELPFTADFAPSGYKRWSWRAGPLVEVPAELLEAIPPPPPQQKKPKRKPKPNRAQYKKAWRRSLAQKKRAKARGGEKPKRGKPRTSTSTPPAAARRPRVPPAHRDESGNATRSARPSAPSGEGRRKRFDRPMPEVFRRANRPAARPSAPRPEEPMRSDEALGRVSIQEERVPAAAARSSVPRLARSAGDANPNPGSDDGAPRRGVTTPEERLPLPRSGVFRRRTVSDTDVPVVVIRRRKR